MRRLNGLDDSKTLSPQQRQRLFERILSVADAIGIGWASHHVIDRDGIAAANRRALLRAVRHCAGGADVLLLDHFALPESPLPQLPLTRGDSLSISIAAASVVAKVVRDRWMCGLDRRFPDYGFARHKGYGTADHREAISRLGPCALHRLSFAPLAGIQR
jgi:ribonuclease HII